MIHLLTNIRFLFILLGPDGKAQQYHEIGRSMATIMTDEVGALSLKIRIHRNLSLLWQGVKFPLFLTCDEQIFHDVAYKAKDRSDLLAGIDEFLDQVTVLPPGEWDPSIRIEPPKNVPSQVHRRFTK